MSCVNRKCVIITVIIIILLLITVGLLVFFLYPRIPTIEQQDTEVNSFQVNSTYARIDANAKVLVNNTNYVKIRLESLNITITHVTDGAQFGSVFKEKFDFPKRKKTVMDVPVLFTITDAQVAQNLVQEMQDTGGYVTLRFSGPISVSYLGVKVHRDIDMTQKIHATSIGG